MKICVVIREYPPNFSGGSVYAFELINAMLNLGHDVYLVAPEKGHEYYERNQIDPTKSEDNILDAKIECNLDSKKIHIVRTTAAQAFGDLFLEIEKINEQVNLDIVHIHFIHPLSILCTLMKMTNGLKTVLTGHGGDIMILLSSINPSTLSALSIPTLEYNSLVLKGMISSYRIMTVSQQLKDFCIEKLDINEEKITHVHHGVNFERFNYSLDGSLIRKKYQLRSSDKIILFTGRLSREKGVKYLIKAMPLIVKNRSDIKLLILGDGPERNELTSLVSSLNLEKAVKFAGVVAFSEVPLYRAASDLLVLPSLNEGTPLSVFESMAMKRPVIATDVGGFTDIIDEDYNGFLVKPRNPSMLAEAIFYLFNDEKKFNKIAKSGYQYVKNFTWEKAAENVLSIYKEVIA